MYNGDLVTREGLEDWPFGWKLFKGLQKELPFRIAVFLDPAFHDSLFAEDVDQSHLIPCDIDLIDILQEHLLLVPGQNISMRLTHFHTSLLFVRA